MGGAGGSLGAAAVARAQPDGYTMLLGGTPVWSSTRLQPTTPPYDPVKEFEPIAIVGFNPT